MVELDDEFTKEGIMLDVEAVVMFRLSTTLPIIFLPFVDNCQFGGYKIMQEKKQLRSI